MRFLRLLSIGILFNNFFLIADPVRGLIASLHVGGQGTFQNHDYTNPAGADGKEKTLNIAATYGVNFGLLNQIEKTKVVVGGEVFFNLSSANQKYVLRTANGTAEGNLQIKNPYLFGAAGILGTMLTPKLMVYAKAGYAWNKAQLKYTNFNNNEQPNGHTYNKVFNGLLGGAGIGYLATNKIMVGGEYVYYNPNGTNPRKISNPEGIPPTRRQFKYHPTMHQVLFKISLLL